MNLVDNALKFAGAAQLEVGSTADGELSMTLDPLDLAALLSEAP